MCVRVCVISSTHDPKLAETWARSLAPLVTDIATVQSRSMTTTFLNVKLLKSDFAIKLDSISLLVAYAGKK